MFANQPSDPIHPSAQQPAQQSVQQSARLRLRLWLMSSSLGAIAWGLFLAQLYHFVGDRLPLEDNAAVAALMRDRFLLCFAFTAPLLGALAYFAILFIVGQRQELEEVRAQLVQFKLSSPSNPAQAPPVPDHQAHPADVDPLTSLQSQLVPMLSRAYRTPLTVILSSNELIEHYGDGWSKERIHRHLKRIRDSVNVMTSLLNDALILVGQSETGVLKFEPATLNLNQFVTDLVASLSAAPPSDSPSDSPSDLTSNSPSDLTSNLSSDSPSDLTGKSTSDSKKLAAEETSGRILCKLLPENISVQGDPKLLRSLLRNLLVNALTYSLPETQVDLVLTYDKTEATFLIRDRGIGIPAADQSNVFKPFFRSKNAKEQVGAGLGLAIAKVCAELHGGAIALTSGPNGTTVTVKLPMPMPMPTEDMGEDTESDSLG